jgi:hypothetical protein
MLIDKTKLTGKAAWEQSMNLFYEKSTTISQYNQNYSHNTALKKLRTNFQNKIFKVYLIANYKN